MGIFQHGVISQAVILSNSSISSSITVDTLFYAVIALAVLFLIMLITYFTSIKPNLKDNAPEKTTYNNSSVDNAIAHIVEKEEELIGDYELVAVITAAIYASMGENVPANGLVVRSIRKVNSKKWINA